MKQLRERLGLRTVDVASYLGVGDSTIRNWEHGRSLPRFDLIEGLLHLYKCSFDELNQAMKETIAQAKKN